ncbi:MAG: hypothetical protein GX222_02510 [Ruminococcaceae bacterium]|nr:hypothetical protein [Oscillospiraceae bacterium]
MDFSAFLTDRYDILALIAVLIITAIGIGTYFFMKKYQTDIRPKKLAEKESDKKAQEALKTEFNSYIRRNEGKALYDWSTKSDGYYPNGILIGNFGVFASVGCDLSGELYTDEKSPTITKIVLDDKDTYPNPFQELRNIERGIIDILRNNKIYRTPVFTAVFFSNKNAKINIPRSSYYLTPKTLRKELRKDQFVEDKGVDIDVVFEALSNGR